VSPDAAGAPDAGRRRPRRRRTVGEREYETPSVATALADRATEAICTAGNVIIRDTSGPPRGARDQRGLAASTALRAAALSVYQVASTIR
jgi:hypothetical protein